MSNWIIRDITRSYVAEINAISFIWIKLHHLTSSQVVNFMSQSLNSVISAKNDKKNGVKNIYYNKWICEVGFFKSFCCHWTILFLDTTLPLTHFGFVWCWG